jgi:hypothetical protein
MKKKFLSQKQKKIFTFGYGNRINYDDLISILTDQNIGCVVDVRLRPKAWTRRWYGEEIKKLCDSIGVIYVNETALGNTSGKSNWIAPDLRAATDALHRVASNLEAGSNSILLLCAEMDNKRCHRSEVAEEVKKILSQYPVEHL